MATIRTAIQVTDGMSPAFKSIINTMNTTISTFEALQSASSSAVDVSSIQAARAELNKAEIAFNGVEKEINEAGQAQKKLNSDIKNGQGAAGGMLNIFKNIAMAAGAAFGVSKIIGLSDAMTSTKARLDLMNDGLQTTAELQKMIMESANDSRAAYTATADAVSKLGILAGGAFSNNKEIIAFSEQMNKNFVIGGASIQEQTAAMYQLTQAMAAGRLQGDEFRSIMENAPLLAQAIAKYMGKTTGELREMSSEGLITADVIKNALFASAEETNKKFAEIPMTFAQVGTLLGNTMLRVFEPVIQMIGKGAQFIYDNWSTLEPVFWGLAAGVGAYAAMMGVSAAATWLADIEHKKLIATMLTSPWLWLAVGIGLVVGWIYKWVQSVGGLEIAWKIAMDAILTTWDKVQIGFMKGTNAVQTFFGNMKVAVLTELQEMINGAIDQLNEFISNVNKIPGVSFDLIAKVSFGSTAAIENAAAISERESNITQAVRGAGSSAAQRQSEITAMQAARAIQEAQGNDFSGLYDGVDATAANTAAMKDSMDASEESLKYMRDLAEQEVINRFTTAEIKIDMTNNNTIGSKMDLDGVVTYLEEKLFESMSVAAEGVYA